MPEHWEPEEKDDPTQPKPKDPNAPDIPSMDVQQTPENTQGDTAADPLVPFEHFCFLSFSTVLLCMLAQVIPLHSFKDWHMVIRLEPLDISRHRL